MGHLDAFRLKDISECTPWTLVQPAWRTNIALSKCKHSCTREGAGGVFSGCDLECLSSAEQYCTRGCYTHANYPLRCAVRCQCSHLSEAIAHKQWQTWTTKTKQTEKKKRYVIMRWPEMELRTVEIVKVEETLTGKMRSIWHISWQVMPGISASMPSWGCSLLQQMQNFKSEIIRSETYTTWLRGKS